MNQAHLPTSRSWLCRAAAVLAFAASLALPAHAQDNSEQPAAETVVVEVQTGENAAAPAADAAAPAEQAAADTSNDRSLIDLFNAGGWTMYPLTALSIMGFALIIYNIMAIKAPRFLAPKVVPEIDSALSRLDVDGARRICEENPAAVTNILNAGLSRVDLNAYNADQVKDALEEASAAELADPFVPINYLSMVGTLSPMVGLLGTVTGMIKGFAAIAGEGMGNPQLLADAISECLITTAVGMIIAIPAMFAYFVFKNRYGKITSQIARIVGDLTFNLGKTLNDKKAKRA